MEFGGRPKIQIEDLLLWSTISDKNTTQRRKSRKEKGSIGGILLRVKQRLK